MSKIIETLKDKVFWINLVVAAIFFNVLIWITLQFLKVYTHHGESIIVPNVKSVHVNKAMDMIENLDLIYEIADSVYNPAIKSGTIVDQQPFAGAIVKSGRTIYLSVSTTKPPLVEMPSLVGKSSLRFAKIELESRGLRLGELTYIPSPEKDAVLEQTIGSTPIRGGILLPKGTTINLTLGDGLTGQLVDVPMLVGRSREEAELIIMGYNLTANFFYDVDVIDSSKGIVYKQYPSAFDEEKLNYGEPIDVFIGTKIPDYIARDTFKMNKIKQ